MVNHLIHVGFPKAGSKSLQDWFERHPAFAFAQWGVAGAAGSLQFEEIFGFRPDLRCAVTSNEGFVSPVPNHRDVDYEDVRSLAPGRESIVRVAEALADLFGGARLLIVTRGFRELFRSYYAQLLVSGCTLSFEEFCGSFLVRDDGTVSVGYDFTIEQYERLFGPDKVLVLPFELLRDRPAAFAAEIETACGVPHADVLPRWVHRSPAPDELQRLARLRRMARSAPIGTAGRELLVRAGRRLISTGLGKGLVQGWTGRSADGDELRIDVPRSLIEKFRGTAERLRNRRHYGGLESEYLL